MSSINFKFAKNWKSFLDWHDAYTKKSKLAPPWIAQKDKIQDLFESVVSNVVDWKTLWKDYESWLRKIYAEKTEVQWSEQQRQVETLLLLQAKELNSENFILIFKLDGKPTVDQQVMTYWEAVRVKQNLEGDSNGVGGNEDIECVTVVNLKKLLS
jgi:hypothetical protein